MTVPLFAGNQVQDFLINADVSEVTDAGSFDPAWVPNSIRIHNTSIPMLTPVFAQQTTIWIHWMGYNHETGGASQPYFLAYNNVGTPVVRLMPVTPSPLLTNLQYWTGSAWSTIGTYTALLDTLLQHDIYIHIAGAASIITWYINKVAVVTGTADYSSVGNIAQAGFEGHEIFTDARVSEVIVSTIDTINRRYNLRLPTANGANTGFTGAYTDVNEVISNNTTFIYAATAGLISTFPTAGKTLTTYAIDAVIVGNVSLADTTGPQNEQWALRIGGTNYLSGVDVPVSFGYTPYRSYLANNPATSAPWTAAAAGDATMEVGLMANT